MAEPGTPFYVGYLPRMDPALARFVRRSVLGFAAGLLATGALLAHEHRRLAAATFDFGAPVTLVGIVHGGAVPWLEVGRPGGRTTEDVAERSRYLLVGPGKNGPMPLDAALLDRPVTVVGTPAYRDGRVVLELASVSTVVDREPDPVPEDVPEALGRHVLVGEIVDSKCFFGVMNPGELASHRACAVRCLSGGIPPTFCVRDEAGRTEYLLLVGPGGRAVGREVLDLVAEPVRIEGDVVRHGDLLVLESDPTTYARLR